MITKDRVRVLVGVLVTLAVVVPLAVLWRGSRMPSSYSALQMGRMDLGGGPGTGQGMSHGMHGVSVRDLDTPAGRTADVVVRLTARQGQMKLADGTTLGGYTLNGTSPGPQIEATVGQLVEVHVRNANVDQGIALHWHGVDVPNAEDGVAGVTQDAIEPGQEHTYRWVAPHAGTFWYHSHQVSHEQVSRGLLGPLVIHPATPAQGVQDVVALEHLYAGDETVNGRRGYQRAEAEPGQPVRLRVINTDNGAQAAWTSTPFTLLSTDGYDVHEAAEVSGTSVSIPAGGRADLGVTVPSDGSAVRLQLSGDVGLLVGPSTAKPPPAVAQPSGHVDRLHYGTPAPIGFDSTRKDRVFRYAIGRHPGFLNGRPGLWWSVNGHIGRSMPMFLVREGDVVHVRISNSSGQVHPMHLHGHHAVVLARNGVKATGSPWWFDSLDVKDGDVFDVAFPADNPGIWMDHCHNLKHATQGLVTHLMYEGVTTPYRLGSDSANEPE